MLHCFFLLKRNPKVENLQKQKGHHVHDLMILLTKSADML